MTLKNLTFLKKDKFFIFLRTPIKAPIIPKKQTTTQKKQILVASKKETSAPSKKIIIPPSTKVASTEIKVTPPKTQKISVENKTNQHKKTSLPPLKDTSKFCWPIEKKAPILSPYGLLSEGKRNDGLNIKVPNGTPILASCDGEIVYVGDKLKNYGLLILIKHTQNFHTTYAHLDKNLVKTGQKVKKGQKIALWYEW